MNPATTLSMLRTWMIVAAIFVMSETVEAQTAPTITRQPAAQKVAVGDPVSFQVVASGPAPVSYQWRRNGVAIGGATAATLTIPAAQLADAGGFFVVVSSGPGSTTSETAVLTVVAPPRIANLSIRTGAGAGAQTLIVGVTAGAGTGRLPALVRGIGPSLAQFGVVDALPALRLSVFAGETLVTSNEGWGGTAEIAARAQQAGAFALSPTSQDAALLTDWSAGGFTVQITGQRGATGVALAEVYDTTAPEIVAGGTALRLVNCSARAQVNAGDGILIAGFTIAGEVPKRILVRGVGPGLKPFGVADALVDPLLTVYDAKRQLVAFNDDWGKATEDLRAAFARVGAFALPEGSLDGALVVSLAPGSYTAQVAGFAAGTGVGLVEIYELP
ncbi:MAG: immunoglobulin domain-containing protein [Verrucomicrobia bacterium]|nr:immunoglobulin domain-containing protein [Verrucomicrobiota bacterium]